MATVNQEMQILTPSPVSSMLSHPAITPEQSSVLDGVNLAFQTPHQTNKLNQVRVMNYPVNRTPCARTPGHALRARKSSLRKDPRKGKQFNSDSK